MLAVRAAAFYVSLEMKMIAMLLVLGAPLVFAEVEEVPLEPVPDVEQEKVAKSEISQAYEKAQVEHQNSLTRLEGVHDELRLARQELEALLTRLEVLKRVHEEEHLREIALRKECAAIERQLAEQIDLEEIEATAATLTDEAKALQEKPEKKAKE